MCVRVINITQLQVLTSIFFNLYVYLYVRMCVCVHMNVYTVCMSVHAYVYNVQVVF